MSKLQIFKNIVNKYPDYSEEEIIRMIGQHSVVSFDVFDTLLKRNVFKPNDIIKYAVQNYCTQHGDVDYTALYEARIKSETEARKNKSSEITCDDISEELKKTMGNPEELLNIEMSLENELCYANRIIKNVYDWCINNNRRVIIISDIYYSKDFIENLLNINGYNLSKAELYISSEVGFTKIKGTIFKEIDYKTEHRNIVHIGDNIISDFIQPMKNGIKAIKIAKAPQRTSYTYISRMQNDCQEYWKKLSTLMSGHLTTRMNEYEKYGYEVVGPLLYGMAKWLHEKAKKEKIEKLFFVSRDGKIIQEVYNDLYGSEAISNKYLYASRASIRFPYIAICQSVDDFMRLFHGRAFDRINCEEFANMICMRAEIVKEAWKRVGLQDKDIININEYKNNYKIEELYNLLREMIIQECIKDRDNYISYLKQIGFEGRVGIIDIGWYGSLQEVTNKLLSNTDLTVRIYGYYLGLRGNHDESYESFIPPEYKPGEYVSNFIEFPFMTEEGSTQTYKREDNSVFPVLSPYEYSMCEVEKMALSKMNSGVRGFIRDFKSSNLTINAQEAYQNMMVASKYPTLKIVNLFGDLMYKENVMRPLAKPRSLLFYAFHPSSFVSDIKKCSWKPGFLKRTFRLDINYYRIIEKLSKIN